jgi:molybdopterin converting factor small subunit
MTITIKIETGNAAFEYEGEEVGRILHELAARVVQRGSVTRETLRDYNGNTVGSVKVTGK